MTRNLEARQLWEWLRPRLDPTLIVEAEQILTDTERPTPRDPLLSAGLGVLMDKATPREVKLSLLRDLLLIIRNSARNQS